MGKHIEWDDPNHLKEHNKKFHQWHTAKQGEMIPVWKNGKRNGERLAKDSEAVCTKGEDTWQRTISSFLAQHFSNVTKLQADFASLDCIVRDRRSTNTSTSSGSGIFNAIAAFSRVSRLGVDLPLNHLDQCLIFTSVTSCKSLYESSKNSSAFVGCEAYINAVICSVVDSLVNCDLVGSFTNVARMTKRLRKQVLCPNQTPAKDGNRPKLYEYYKKRRGRFASPSFTMPSFENVGGTVMQDYLTQIPVGREGYIYLIHAEGTNRYKIGRSVNPIARAADIQKQSPYQLKIISAWTLDAPTDEAKLHKRYADWRIFGEWFELDQLLEGIEGYKVCDWETRLYAVSLEFEYLLPTMRSVAKHSIKELSNFLDCDLHSFYPLLSATGNINFLFEELSSREEVRLSQDFITCLLPRLILDNYRLPDRNAIIAEFSEPSFALWLNAFITGAIAAFKSLVLNKGGLS